MLTPLAGFYDRQRRQRRAREFNGRISDLNIRPMAWFLREQEYF